MSPETLYVRRPRLLALTVLLIAAAGVAALALLPRAEDPELTGRFANVTTILPGADAARVEALVTEPIEDRITEFEEVKALDSNSRAGISIVTIELADDIYGSETDEIWSRIRDELSDVAAELPRDASVPEFEEMSILAYTMMVGLTWELEDSAPDRAILGRLAEDLVDRFRGLSGTEDVTLYGAPEEEVLVEVDPLDLAAHGLTTNDLAAAIAGADSKVPAGQMRGAQNDLLLEVSGELDGLDRIAELPLRSGADGRLLRLADVATVAKSEVLPRRETALVSGREGVVVSARMSSSRRVDVWAAEARALVAEFTEELPRGIEARTIFDQSRYTEGRLSALFTNFALGALFVMVVLLFTMGWRSALLVGSALPLTTLMVLAGMRWLGIPMHQMSIAGLIIALGLLIDNAIVIVDEVRHRLGHHEDPVHAVGAAVRHLFVPLFGSTLTTCLAFAPIALMPGPAGEFVGPMALSVILAVGSSFLLAMTVTPALAGWLEKLAPTRGESWLARGVTLPRLGRFYEGALTFFIQRPILGVALALALPLAGGVAATRLPEQFFPPADRDQFVIDLYLEPTASLARTEAVSLRARELLLEHDRVRDAHLFLGRSAPKFYYNLLENVDGASFYAQALVELDGPKGSLAVIRELQEKLDSALPGAMVLTKQIEQGPPFNAPVELHVYGPDTSVLQEVSDDLRAVLGGLPHVIHTRATVESPAPKLTFGVDEAAARRAGASNVELAGLLQASLEGLTGGSLVEGSEELPVRVRVASPSRDDAADAGALPLLARGAQSAAPSWGPLDALGEVGLAAESAGITHKDGERASSVQGYLEAGVLPSTVLAALEAELERIGYEAPRGYRIEVGGESAERDEAVGNLASSAALLMILMLAALVLSFDSFRLAALIGSVGLLSVGLALLSVALYGAPFGFMTIVGAMGLVGVAINDSIVVLAALREDEGARRGDVAATVRVVQRATRHVVSTTLTTAVGFLPLVLGGGGFWPPVGVAIGGGVLGATVIALTYVPTVHRVLARRRSSRSRQVSARSTWIPVGETAV